MILQVIDQVIREMSIGLEYMVVILELVFGIDILNKYLKSDKLMRRTDSHTILLAIGMALFLLAIGTADGTVLTWYTQNEKIITGWVADFIGASKHVLQILMVAPFPIIAERILWPRLQWKVIKRRVITFSAFVEAGVIMILILSGTFLMRQDILDGTFAASTPHNVLENPFVLVAFGIGLGEIALVGFVGFLLILRKLTPYKHEKRLIFKGLTFGIIGLGTWLVGGYIKGLPEIIWSIPCSIVTVVCVILVHRYLCDIPSYSELDWKKGIIAIYVFDASGMPIYSHDFRQAESELVRESIKQAYNIPKDKPAAQLVTGGMIGIQSLLSEITQDSGPLGVVNIGGKSLILGQGKMIFTMVIVDQNLLVYHSIMRDIARDIEEAYPNIVNRKLDELPKLDSIINRYIPR